MIRSLVLFVHITGVLTMFAGFALEAFAELLGGYFDGDFAVEARVSGAIDLAHAALADQFDDFVGSEILACGKGHGRDSD